MFIHTGRADRSFTPVSCRETVNRFAGNNFGRRPGGRWTHQIMLSAHETLRRYLFGKGKADGCGPLYTLFALMCTLSLTLHAHRAYSRPLCE
jgi:hypothetical protein